MYSPHSCQKRTKIEGLLRARLVGSTAGPGAVIIQGELSLCPIARNLIVKPLAVKFELV
jgi:hypothetical protein